MNLLMAGSLFKPWGMVARNPNLKNSLEILGNVFKNDSISDIMMHNVFFRV